MKDFMKKFLLCLTLAVSVCGFSACGNDDDNDGVGNAENLYGYWTLVKEVWYEDGEVDFDIYQPGETILCFKEDGTGYMREEVWSEDFEYMLSGNQLTILLVDDEEFFRTKVSSLSATELVLVSEGYDGEYYKYEDYYVRY